MSERACVLVTGGSGFIGRHLVPRLAARGHDVTVSSRDPQRAARVLPEGTRIVADVTDPRMPAPDVLVNLAGAGIADRPWTPKRRAELLDSREAFTSRLRASLGDRQPSVVVSGSAVGWYGTSEHRRFTEEDPPGEGFAAELCRRWEAAARPFEADGARLVLLRTGLVLGDGGLLAKMKTPFLLGLGGRLGHGRQLMSWIHIEDELALIERAIEDDSVVGPLNLTAPNPVSNAEFTRALGRALKRPTPLPVPGPVLATLLGDMARELLLAGAAVLPARAEALGHEFRFPHLDGALDDLVGRR